MSMDEFGGGVFGEGRGGGGGGCGGGGGVWWGGGVSVPTVATVSSLPWVKTTTLCLFLLTLGRLWACLATSAMSSVCEHTRTPA